MINYMRLYIWIGKRDYLFATDMSCYFRVRLIRGRLLVEGVLYDGNGPKKMNLALNWLVCISKVADLEFDKLVMHTIYA